MENAYWFPTGEEYEGWSSSKSRMLSPRRRFSLTVRTTGNFTRNQSISLMTAEEFKAGNGEGEKCKIRVHPAHGDQAVRNGSQTSARSKPGTAFSNPCVCRLGVLSRGRHTKGQCRSLTIAARHSFHVAILRDGYGSARAGDRSERLARAAGKCAAVVLAVILPDHMQAC
jgi:hypothetical protein